MSVKRSVTILRSQQLPIIFIRNSLKCNSLPTFIGVYQPAPFDAIFEIRE